MRRRQQPFHASNRRSRCRSLGVVGCQPFYLTFLSRKKRASLPVARYGRSTTTWLRCGSVKSDMYPASDLDEAGLYPRCSCSTRRFSELRKALATARKATLLYFPAALSDCAEVAESVEQRSERPCQAYSPAAVASLSSAVVPAAPSMDG